MKLEYNKDTDRYNDFHCGEVFKIKINNTWKTVRIEKNNNWYVIDNDGITFNCQELEGNEIQEI